ncbi:uncharacterized protein [Aegilops tauschii subsp. strangulata]|nr:uncharacterized protein LOC109732830 [Aegilops tauschii subsp. strangulata]
MPSWLELCYEWEIQAVVVASFSLQVILFFFAGIRRYNISPVLKVLLWLVYLFADFVAMYALGHMSSSLSKKSSGENQLVAFWAPFLLLHLGGQDTITAYALEDNKLWLRQLLNMFLQVSGTTYVLYKYIIAGGASFIPAAMLVLAAGVVKYGERIWAMKLASKGGSPFGHRKDILGRICSVETSPPSPPSNQNICRWIYDRFTKNKQFRTYAFLVTEAHALRHVLAKPLVIDGNEKSYELDRRRSKMLIYRAHEYSWDDGKGGHPWEMEKRNNGDLYRAIEVQLALMYDVLYTKAGVVHKRRGQWIRAISLGSCFAALVVFTQSNRDGYSTPNIVITFTLLGGACALEVASLFKAIGSTWTYAILRNQGWIKLANAILFARHQLIVVKDGRWSDSVGQYNLISFCVHNSKDCLKRRIAKWIGVKVLWDKAQCTKHPKLSSAVKDFVWGFLKSYMFEIEEVDIQSGNWARRFSGFDFDQSQQLDWSLSCEFHKSVLIWHIATSTFLNHPAVQPEPVDKDMAEAVNTLSDYMMYLLVRYPEILPKKPATRDLLQETCSDYAENMISSKTYNVVDSHQIILDFKKGHKLTHHSSGSDVLFKASILVGRMLNMELGLKHKMKIFGKVWTEMLCYAATNASGGFHARQLSNGGEFLTHILLLSKHYSLLYKKPRPFREADETVKLTASDGCN